MKIQLDHVYFLVEDMERAVHFYETFLDTKVTHKEGDRWADFEIEGQDGMYFGLLNKKAIDEKIVVGNNAVLGIYTEDIQKAFEKAKSLGATVLYEPDDVQDSPYKYVCFGMLDLDGNVIEVANYER